MRRALTLVALLLLARPALAGDVLWKLTEDGRYVVQISQVDGQTVAYLRNVRGTWSKTSPRFVDAMRSGLSVSVDGRPVRVIPLDGAAPPASGSVGEAKDLVVSLYGQDLAHIRQVHGQVFLNDQRTLTAFDVRKFASDKTYAETFRPVARYRADPRLTTRTDLHTHLAGHLEFDSLVKMGVDHDVQYPTALLDRIGVLYPQGAVKDGKISMRTLVASREFKDSHGMAALEDAMMIEPSQIRTFLDMEDKYVFRGPITKGRDAKLIRDMLWSAARTSAKSGIRYIEPSDSSVLNPDYLKIVNEEVPKIEKQLGVKMRFVAGLWRHSDTEWNLDEVTRLKRMLQSSPYIVGADIMGHETNQTKDLARVLQALQDIKRTPGLEHFQIRVHGGENPLYPGNVPEAAELGATRVGHGLYITKDQKVLKLDPYTDKIDAQALEAIKKAGIYVELNPGSNLALNNLSGGTKVLLSQLRQFRAAGIPTILSTDGVGMYGAAQPDLQRMLRQNGFTDADLAWFHQSEQAYVKSVETATQQRAAYLKAHGEPIPSQQQLEAFVDQQGRHYTPELKAKLAAEQEARLAAFKTEFADKGIAPFDPDAFKGMQVIDVSGGSMKQFKEMREAGRFGELKTDQARELFRQLLTKLDPAKVYFQTGGTQFGYEAILHEEVARFNAEAAARGAQTFHVVGVLPEAANPKEVFGPAGQGITDYKLAGKGWADFSLHKLDALSENGGVKLLFGGNMFVADEGRRVINADLPFKTLYFDQAVGASGDLARELPGALGANNGAFHDVNDLLAHLASGSNASILTPAALDEARAAIAAQHAAPSEPGAPHAAAPTAGNGCVAAALQGLIPK